MLLMRRKRAKASDIHLALEQALPGLCQKNSKFVAMLVALDFSKLKNRGNSQSFQTINTMFMGAVFN